MKGVIGKVLCCLAGVVLLAGCDAAFVAGGRTIGFNSGRFVFTDGSRVRVYPFPLPVVQRAAEEVLREMKVENLEKSGGIARSSLKGTVHDDKVSIQIAYVAADQTSVAVLVGMGGTYTAAQLIHERIAEVLRHG